MTRLARALGFTALLLGAAGTIACAGVVAPKAAVAQEQLAKKRGPPPAAAPVSAAGVRYEAIIWGRRRGLEQNGGYVAAVDRKTGRELWVARIYDATPHDPDMEDDKQDLFIARLELVEHGRALRVTDERGGRYRLDIATRTVTAP
jgi:hypothetical protein